MEERTTDKLQIVLQSEFTYCPVITKKEFFFPFLIGIIICVLGTLPYLYGYAIAGDDRVFMGMVGRGTLGSNGYLMFQRQAWEGKWLLENKCTPESTSSFCNVEWWLLGRTARLLNMSILSFFHVDRCLSVFLFLFAVYYLLAINLDNLEQRRFSLLLITIGSGFGWLIWCLNRYTHLSLPLSWDIDGIQVFSYLVCKPHFIRSFALAILMYAFLIRGFQSGKAKYFILSGLMALSHSLMRPFLIPESYIMFLLTPILFCWTQKQWEIKWFLFCAIPSIIHFPAILYYLWMSISDPLKMSGWSQNHQFLGKSGFLIEYVAGVGWTWLICMIFFIYLAKKCQQRISHLILFTWVMVAWGICNLYPYWKPGQESGLYAFLIVPPILTIVGPYQWITDYLKVVQDGRNLANRVITPIFFAKTRLAFFVILLSIPTTVFVYYFMFHDLKYGHPLWTYYLQKDSYAVLEYLQRSAKENDVVLASPRTSQFIYAHTPCKTVTGHFMLTKDYVKKTEDVNRFYYEKNNVDIQKQILAKYKVTYVFFGSYEQEMSGLSPPEVLKDSPTVFERGNTKLYDVSEVISKNKDEL
ncbi:MAG TPA: hypothetical protein PLJ10_10925 [Candidatus Hydrogenedens sp.]|nr:hypothetical protein [Candidatus Hydrogenedens sp.]